MCAAQGFTAGKRTASVGAGLAAAGGAGAARAAPTAAELEAAMHAAEDDADAALTAAAERENAAEARPARALLPGTSETDSDAFPYSFPFSYSGC